MENFHEVISIIGFDSLLADLAVLELLYCQEVLDLRVALASYTVELLYFSQLFAVDIHSQEGT